MYLRRLIYLIISWIWLLTHCRLSRSHHYISAWLLLWSKNTILSFSYYSYDWFLFDGHDINSFVEIASDVYGLFLQMVLCIPHQLIFHVINPFHFRLWNSFSIGLRLRIFSTYGAAIFWNGVWILWIGCHQMAPVFSFFRITLDSDK